MPDIPELSGDELWPDCEELVSPGWAVSPAETPDVPVPVLSGVELVPDLSVEPALDLSTELLLEELSLPELPELLPDVSVLELLLPEPPDEPSELELELEPLPELSEPELPPESPDAATAPMRGVRSKSPTRIITTYFFIFFPPFGCVFPDIAGIIKEFRHRQVR